MKRKLHILSIIAVMLSLAVLMVACNGNSKTDPNALTLSSADTLGLSAFQSWKANEFYKATNEAAHVKTTTTRKTTSVPVSQPIAQPTKKKGWSKAAKGAVIGGTGGAIAGVIINKKNRVLGGIVGGVLGGGIGYGIGRRMDKKDGRN